MIRAQFAAHYGHPPDLVATAPGRVNLIGEHTDYNDGFVFPAAIDRGLTLAMSFSDGESRLVSAELGDGEPFDVATIEPGGLASWSKYPAGMAWVLRQEGKTIPNIKAFLTSTVPIGSGVSSSAAIEMAFGVAWNAFANLGISNFDLALLGQRCENRFLGLATGIMDQMASAMGREGHAMFLDTRSLQIDYAPLPEGITMVLLDTNKPRALTESAYNERRAQCEAASTAIGVSALRDASLAGIESHQGQITDVVFRRARHVITENARALAFKDALHARDLSGIGDLMRASHESLRDDYEVSCRELDIMAAAAWDTPGCIGARMMGAGFGGACIALVRTTDQAEFIATVLATYSATTGREGDAFTCRAAAGAHIIDSL